MVYFLSYDHCQSLESIVRIILLGPPGAGKGTQAEFICNALHIPHISTGDMLRTAIAKQDDFGKSIEATVAKGELVSDEIMIKIVQLRIKEADCAQGYILDGFPRTSSQAQAIEDAGIKLDFVVQIKVPDEQIIQRLSGRRVHLASGRTYNIYFHKPQHEGLDDVTGEPLVQRPDDAESVVRDRLQVYHKKTQPLIEWYTQRANGLGFLVVDGTQGEKNVRDEILTKINPKL